MPVCQKCQTPYDEWQHFCLHCGEYLRAKPLPFHRCPQCGIEVAPEHTFCHKCAVPLKEDASRPSRLISRWKWLTGGLIAAILILGTIFAFYFITWPRRVPAPMAESPSTSPTVDESRAVSGAGKANGTSPAVDSLQAELEKVITKIKEANLNKNLLLYMDALSESYPQLEKKRQEVSKTWEIFDFQKMAFNVNNLQEDGSDNAVAEVNWSTLAQNMTTRGLQTGKFHYRVWFVKELGQWKIKKIEELQPRSMK